MEALNRLKQNPYTARTSIYRPSADWAQGGPLIEQYGVTVEYAMVGMGDWHAYQRNDEENVGFYASTPPVSAMRAIVASELGDTVDVPGDLVKS